MKYIRTILIFATSYFPYVGGAQVAVREVCKRLPNRRFILICPKLKKGLATVERIDNVMVHRIGFGSSIDRFIFPLTGALYALIKFGRQNLIWAILANYGGFAAYFYNLLSFNRNPMVLTLQEGFTFNQIKQKAGPFYFLIPLLTKKADYLHVISTFLLELGRKFGFSSEQYSIIPNGVDLNIFKPINKEQREKLREHFKININEIALCTASRLTEKNGIRYVLDALTFLPARYSFYIAGTGEEEHLLKQIATEKHIENRVHFLGDLQSPEVAKLMQASDIFIRPSITEGLGNCFLEAMACKLPIIATMEGGIKDFLQDGQNGIAVIPKDAESIKNGILRYSNDSLYKEIQENGLRLVTQNYDWDKIAPQMEYLFLDLEKII